MVCVFHDRTVILLWKLSAWGGTPTSGKTLLSELISGKHPSLSISLVCLRTGPGAPAHSHAHKRPMKEQRGEQVEGEGRAGEVSPKTLDRDWNILHCCAVSPSVPEKALPWHITVNTGRHHGNTAIWHRSNWMRYGTNEEDNSLNNYSFPLMCYKDECSCVWQKRKCVETSVSHITFWTKETTHCWFLKRQKSGHKLEVVWGAYEQWAWGGALGVKREKGGSHAPRLFITNATSRWDLQSCTLASVFFSQWKAPEVVDGKHGQL